MRLFPKTILSVGLALSLPLAAIAQSEEAATPKTHLSGSKDPKLPIFHPDNAVVPEAAAAAPVAGTITVTLHITLKTAVAAGDKVGCTASLLASYSSTLGSTAYDEEASAYATVSGSTATCVLTIPHSWLFPSTTTHEEGLSGGYSAVIFNPAATGVTASILTRSSGSDFVDLTGANIFATAPTTYSVNVTL